MPRLVTVVTTIQPPTNSMVRLSETLNGWDVPLIVIGDTKGPDGFALPRTRFVSLEKQLELPFALASELPTGHYARKNIGYLLAIEQKAECIFETDDDNCPTDVWKPRALNTQARQAENNPWINVYRLFTDEVIWPRGFLLDKVTDPSTYESRHPLSVISVDAPIQQGLVNEAPDVDAVWRLVFDRVFNFGDDQSVRLAPGTWCPFNSQSTWWWPIVYPLLYLPSYCSFRMTDIWRSFVAQRCLWELDKGVVFHAPEGAQHRNEHDLMKDFGDETSGYLGNRRMTDLLADLALSSSEEDVPANLLACYAMLVEQGMFPNAELDLVSRWAADVRGLMRSGMGGVDPDVLGASPR